MIIREEVFVYQELTQDGDPIGDRREFNLTGLRNYVSLVCPRYGTKKLEHMLSLLKAARAQGFTKNPVDLTQWNDAQTALAWSARVWVKSQA